MKIFIWMMGLLSVTAFAGNGRVYLGGATDVNNCAAAAGQQGFAFGVYGAGYDDAGVYYPYFNACFGEGRKQSYQLPYIPVPVPGEPRPLPERPAHGKTVRLPETMDANSMQAVLMNGMSHHLENGGSLVTRTSKGLSMRQGRVTIHCFSERNDEGGVSLPVQSQACDITVD